MMTINLTPVAALTKYFARFACMCSVLKGETHHENHQRHRVCRVHQELCPLRRPAVNPTQLLLFFIRSFQEQRPSGAGSASRAGRLSPAGRFWLHQPREYDMMEQGNDRVGGAEAEETIL